MNQFQDLLLAEFRRRLFHENVPRLKKCLHELTEAETWFRPNDNSNSAGNLVLHLCGNVSQWVLSGLGGYPDHRERQSEFDERGPIATQELIRRLDGVMAEVEKVLDKLTQEQILGPVSVQGFRENGVSVLVHVVEHFSYHVGQVTYFVKWRKNMDMSYYGGLNLDAKS